MAAIVATVLLMFTEPVASQALNPFFGGPSNPPSPSPETAPPAGPSPVGQPPKAPTSDIKSAPSPQAASSSPSPSKVESQGGANSGKDTAAAALASIPNPGITLMFDNADIYDVLKVVLGDALKLDYVVDPSVQGRITMKSSTAVSLADIFSVLETALAISNVSIIKQDKIYKVVKDVNAAREKLPNTGAGPASPILQIIPVRFVQANQLVTTLRNFVGAQAVITNDPTNRYLIVADRSANIEKIVDMVATLDVDYLQQVKIKLIPMVNTDASDIAKELDALFKSSGMFNWTGTDGTKAYFLPITRMNAVLVATANEKLLAAAEQWIKTLDSEPKNGLGSFVHIYSVANGNATHLAEILRQLFGGASGSATGTSRTGAAGGATSGSVGAPSSSVPGVGAAGGPALGAATTTITRGNVPASAGATGTASGLGGSVQVIADEVTNTLIIKASSQDFDQIKKVLSRVDTVPKQVLIQVMVAEVALNDTLQYGVEWWLSDTLKYNGKSWAAKAGLGGVIAPPVTPGIVAGAGGGLNYSVFNTTGQIIGLLNLLGQDTTVNVLSTPHVMAADGKLARIEVGDEVAVVTQTSSTPSALGGTSISNSVTYRPTGIILEVTPVISASGRVSLTVSQEVSTVQPIGSSVGGITYPNFSKRKVSTEVIVEDGKPLLIAGLIRDSGNNSVAGIPGLKDVPLFGALFGSTKNVREKTELIMSITSFIVNDKADGDRVTTQFQNALKDLKPLIKKGLNPLMLEAPATTSQPSSFN